MFSEETRAAAKDPSPTLSFIWAVLDSPTDVLTEIFHSIHTKFSMILHLFLPFY